MSLCEISAWDRRLSFLSGISPDVAGRMFGLMAAGSGSWLWSGLGPHQQSYLDCTLSLFRLRMSLGGISGSPTQRELAGIGIDLMTGDVTRIQRCRPSTGTADCRWNAKLFPRLDKSWWIIGVAPDFGEPMACDQRTWNGLWALRWRRTEPACRHRVFSRGQRSDLRAGSTTRKRRSVNDTRRDDPRPMEHQMCFLTPMGDIQ